MQENLKRDIGTFALACTVINLMVGTGIFVLPALAAEKLGAAAIICFFICGFLIFLIALCFAEIGSKVSVSGGTYTYIQLAFGPYVGFLANNLFWFGSCVLGDAAIANALAKTLSYYFPALDSTVVHTLFLLLLFGGLAYINVRGAKYGVGFVVLLTFAKLIPLLLIVGFGAFHIAKENLSWQHAPALHDIGSATLILFFAFLGIESAINNGGEFKNPSRTVPLGILSGLSFVVIFYVAIQVIAQGILGGELLAHKDAPLVAVASRLFGNSGITLLVCATAVSMLGVLSGEILGNSRILFAGARDGILPGFLAKVQPKYYTPHLSIIAYSALGFIFAVMGAFKQLIILSSASSLLIYLGVVLATIRLRYKKTTQPEKTFTIPGGILIPVMATAIILWVLSNLSIPEITGIIIALLALSLIYVLMNFIKTRKKPVPQKTIEETVNDFMEKDN